MPPGVLKEVVHICSTKTRFSFSVSNYCKKSGMLTVLPIFDSTCCNHDNSKSSCLSCSTTFWVSESRGCELCWNVLCWNDGVRLLRSCDSTCCLCRLALLSFFFFFVNGGLLCCDGEDGWMRGRGGQMNGRNGGMHVAREEERGGGYVTLRFRSASRERVCDSYRQEREGLRERRMKRQEWGGWGREEEEGVCSFPVLPLIFFFFTSPSSLPAR